MVIRVLRVIIVPWPPFEISFSNHDSKECKFVICKSYRQEMINYLYFLQIQACTRWQHLNLTSAVGQRDIFFVIELNFIRYQLSFNNSDEVKKNPLLVTPFNSLSTHTPPIKSTHIGSCKFLQDILWERFKSITHGNLKPTHNALVYVFVLLLTSYWGRGWTETINTC